MSAMGFIRTLIVFSKFPKIFTQKVTGKPPATSCLVLAQQDGADGVVGFFVASYRKTGSQIRAESFRRKKPEDGFDNVPLVTVDAEILGYGCRIEPSSLVVT